MSYAYGGLNLPSTGDTASASSVAENFELAVKNSASSTAPSGPVTGQMWYDTANSVLKVWNGSTWISTDTSLIPSQTGNNGKFLTTNGSSLSWATAGGNGGGYQILTATSGTFTVPTNVNSLLVYAFAGGEGGSGGRGTALRKGNPGGAVVAVVPVTPGQSIPYTVGAGGRGGWGMTNGNPGGNTVFGNVANTETSSYYVFCRGGYGLSGYTILSNGAQQWQTYSDIFALMGGSDGTNGSGGYYGYGGGRGLGSGGGGQGGASGTQGTGGVSNGPGVDGIAGGVYPTNPINGQGNGGGGSPTGIIKTAGTFTLYATYKIATVGTTDFTAIGASSNTVGVLFQALGPGSGTGTAEEFNGGAGGYPDSLGGGGGGGGGGGIVVVWGMSGTTYT